MTRRFAFPIAGRITAACLVLALAACADASDPRNTQYPDHDLEERYRYGSISGGQGFLLFGEGEEDEPESGIGVNSFLWRASLDTLAFLPITSADPFGGVILTDWYTPPDSPSERFKVQLYILDRQLRADGIRAAVFRQVRTPEGDWVSAEVGDLTARQLEDAILTRARELRISQTAER